MNYYERIQRSIDFIEENLTEDITIERCAREAYMSVSGYHRMFLSIVGYGVGEYIRMRRLTKAGEELACGGQTVIGAAMKYGYTSVDSFSRAFKRRFGVVPSKVRFPSPELKGIKFERVNLMEAQFEEERELAQKYPDIKVIRSLEPMKAACFTYYGEDPESHAFDVLRQWANEHDVFFRGQGYRVFGYNNPDPSEPGSDETYGYEVCVTIPDALYEMLEDVPEGFERGTYDGVKRRVLSGGKYAVTSVRRDAQGEIGGEIINAWKRFSTWLHESRYIWGGGQYLEEHFGFNAFDDHIGGVDLFISIQDAPKLSAVIGQEEEIPACRAVVFRTEGADALGNAKQSWARALAFAKAHGLDPKACRVFRYDKGFSRTPPFFCVVMIALPDSFEEALPEMEAFPGGWYMTAYAEQEHIAEGWMRMERWRKESKSTAGNHQWLEEWTLDNWSSPCGTVKLCYPIAK